MTSRLPQYSRMSVTATIELPATRDRQQVILALGARNLDQIPSRRPHRASEDRLRNRDLVVLREALNNPDRCVVDQRKTRRELGTYHVDLLDQESPVRLQTAAPDLR